MKERQKETPQASLDVAELLVRVENDRKLLRELLMIGKEDLPKHMRSLREAVESSDGKSVTSAAHTLKGMLANLSANRASDVAAQLERMGRRGEKAGLEEVLVLLEREALRVLQEVEHCMTGVGG